MGRIEEGARADLVALNVQDPALAGIEATPDSAGALLGALAVAGHNRLVRDVWVGGRHVVNDGAMIRWTESLKAYLGVVRKIWG